MPLHWDVAVIHCVLSLLSFHFFWFGNVSASKTRSWAKMKRNCERTTTTKTTNEYLERTMNKPNTVTCATTRIQWWMRRNKMLKSRTRQTQDHFFNYFVYVWIRLFVLFCSAIYMFSCSHWIMSSSCEFLLTETKGKQSGEGEVEKDKKWFRLPFSCSMFIKWENKQRQTVLILW